MNTYLHFKFNVDAYIWPYQKGIQYVLVAAEVSETDFFKATNINITVDNWFSVIELI